ncbi:MAG TPA: hydrogenase nickel incorporation protein HypB [Planctomycetota bacterium]|nr:hydrogenase nickel incorporation protein HypB [Planctomycetota bacterium]
MKIVVVKNVLGHNARRAAALKRRFLQARCLAVNILGSPGAGKTSLLEKLIPVLKRRRLSVAVIEGDIATANDARRIEKAGAPAVQITTQGVCHLNAAMIDSALRRLGKLPDVLFIENVGNLVCPAAFELGEAERLVVLSVPEGDDKPAKYPEAFAGASAMVLNKLDLGAHCRFNRAKAILAARSVNPGLAVFETSCADCRGIPELAAWLTERRAAAFGGGRSR